jgi:adenine-specific DNA glycosylase
MTRPRVFCTVDARVGQPLEHASPLRDKCHPQKQWAKRKMEMKKKKKKKKKKKIVLFSVEMCVVFIN